MGDQVGEDVEDLRLDGDRRTGAAHLVQLGVDLYSSKGIDQRVPRRRLHTFSTLRSSGTYGWPVRWDHAMEASVPVAPRNRPTGGLPFRGRHPGPGRRPPAF